MFYLKANFQSASLLNINDLCVVWGIIVAWAISIPLSCNKNYFILGLSFLITFPFSSLSRRAPRFWLNNASKNVVTSSAESPRLSLVPASFKSNAVDVGSWVWRSSHSPNAPFDFFRMKEMIDTHGSQPLQVYPLNKTQSKLWPTFELKVTNFYWFFFSRVPRLYKSLCRSVCRPVGR